MYPPPPPYDPPTGYPPPPKRNRILLWFFLIFVLFLCLASASPDFRQGLSQGLKPMVDAWNNVHQSTVDTTPVDTTPAPEWTITQTFSGTGTSKTATFTTNGDWQLNWYCSLPASGTGLYTITIDVDRPGQKSPVEPFAVNAICFATFATSGSVTEHQSGTLYLSVTSDTQWTVQIEQLL
jgi:hypothetical protein